MASFSIAVIGAALVVCPVLVAQQAEPRRIATAPAFNARALTSNPTKDWITNGGTVFNQRYSPLTLLDRTNVKDLKALWRTGMGTGAAPNNSGQAQILHHQGTLFVIRPLLTLAVHEAVPADRLRLETLPETGDQRPRLRDRLLDLLKCE